MMEKKSGRGGRRSGAGRPKGSVGPGGVRSQHQVRAFDDEWDLIRRFADLVKQGKLEACKQFLEEAETADNKNTDEMQP